MLKKSYLKNCSEVSNHGNVGNMDKGNSGRRNTAPTDENVDNVEDSIVWSIFWVWSICWEKHPSIAGVLYPQMWHSYFSLQNPITNLAYVWAEKKKSWIWQMVQRKAWEWWWISLNAFYEQRCYTYLSGIINQQIFNTGVDTHLMLHWLRKLHHLFSKLMRG